MVLPGDAAAIPTVADDLATFQAAADLVIQLEGGDRLCEDMGGLTKFGISQRAYPNLDIRSLDRAAAEQIYRADYWLKVRAHQLPPALALALFDTAVNVGPGRAARLLQRTLRVPEDGLIGAQTIGAARAFKPQSELVGRFLARRCRYYRVLAENRPGVYRPYLDGWVARVCRVAVEAGRLSA